MMMQRTESGIVVEDAAALAQWLSDCRNEFRRPPTLYLLADITRFDDAARDRLAALAGAGGMRNLYDDLEGIALAESGPRLLALDENTIGAVAELALAAYGASFLYGPPEQATIVHHLQSMREVELPDGGRALFRYQDTQVTSALFALLAPTQSDTLLGPLDAWVTPDVCRRLHVIYRRRHTPANDSMRFNSKTFDALESRLFVHTVAAQVREVDTSLLAQYSPCEAHRLLEARIARARELGLQQQADISLFCVLSVQLPEGFEHESPFAQALDRKQGHLSFGAALDAVPSKLWDDWDARMIKS